MDKDDEESMASARKLPPPLRIVDTEDATASPEPPHSEFPAEQAITRKVRNPLVEGAEPATPPPAGFPVVPGMKSAKLPGTPGTRRLVLAGVAVFGVVVGAAGLWKVMRRPVAESPIPAAASAPSTPASHAVAVPAEGSPPVRAISHIDISVQPADATLVLDDTTAGGNRIKAVVPRDEKRHVVEARAPGYEPFKKVVSFATDVYRDIELKRQPSPMRAPVRAKAPQGPSRPRSDLRSAEEQPEDFGMKLERPAPRRPAKKIDEKDPYSP